MVELGAYNARKPILLGRELAITKVRVTNNIIPLVLLLK